MWNHHLSSIIIYHLDFWRSTILMSVASPTDELLAKQPDTCSMKPALEQASPAKYFPRSVATFCSMATWLRTWLSWYHGIHPKKSEETNKFSSPKKTRRSIAAWSEAPHWALVTSSHPGQIIFMHPSLGHGMPTRFVGSWLLLDWGCLIHRHLKNDNKKGARKIGWKPRKTKMID